MNGLGIVDWNRFEMKKKANALLLSNAITF